MRILAIERELGVIDPAAHASLLRAEAAAVWALQQRDVIRTIWFTRADHCAVLLLEAPGAAMARRTLAALPLVRAGLITFDVYELQSYDGFARLFSAGPSHARTARRRPARIRRAKVK